MPSPLLTAYDTATLRRHTNPMLRILVDPSTNFLKIVDNIHIEENFVQGYAASSVDYSRFFGQGLTVWSNESALDVVTSLLRSAFADSGVTLAAKRFGPDGETIFDLVLALGS